MTIQIDQMPVPSPMRSMAQAAFDAAMAAWVAAYPDSIDQHNAQAVEANANAIAAAASAAAAAVSQAAAATSQASAAASAASAIASPSTNGTSTTSLTLGAGNQSLTTQTGKNWAPGMWINCVRTSDRSKGMSGYIDSYNSGTGALVLVVVAANVSGTGTFTDWTLTVAGLPGSIFNLVDLSLLGPSIRPSLLCDFANAKRLDSRFVYTMTSPLSYYDAARILRYAPAGLPAFDHDPSTGRCLGLSMWEARTNVALWSEVFSNAAHTKTRATITDNAIVAPDGNTTADKLVEDSTASSTHFSQQNYTGLTAGQHTYSVFAKKGERTRIAIGAWDGTTGVDVVFNLNTGVIDVIGAGATPKIEALPNDWYRCIVTRSIASTTLQVSIYLDSGSSGGISNSYSGNGTSGAYIWGLDVEPGAFASPYKPATSAPVTRSAPTLTMATSAFDFNAAEGTLYASATLNNSVSGAANCLAVLDDGTMANKVSIYRSDISTSNVLGYITSGGVDVAAIQYYSVASGQAKAALAYKVNDAALSVNGTSPGTDTSLSVPSLTTLRIGKFSDGTNHLNGWLDKVAVFPKRLTNNELVALSTL